MTARLNQLEMRLEKSSTLQVPSTREAPIIKLQLHAGSAPRRTRSIGRWSLDLLWCLVLGFWCFATATGCRQEMYDQPRHKPLHASAFFSDGMSARPLLAGTVPRGFLHTNDAVDEGLVGTNLVEEIPIPVTPQLLQRGQERYDIYCSVCHDQNGEGNGMIVQRGFPRPPSFHIERLRQAPAGHFFRVITHGYGVMYPYANRVAPEDRWSITAYIRALQLSHGAPIASLPPDLRAQPKEAAR
jgi:mono/diheme cytochrome c family protein